MAVIINEFEIITNPTKSPEGQAPPAQQPTEAPLQLRPQDIDRIVRHERQRRERIRAN
jgi:hypothetical protein